MGPTGAAPSAEEGCPGGEGAVAGRKEAMILEAGGMSKSFHHPFSAFTCSIITQRELVGRAQPSELLHAHPGRVSDSQMASVAFRGADRTLGTES